MKKLLTSSLLLLAAAAPLRAAGPYLHRFDWEALLPAPPPAHGAEDKADRDETYAVYQGRTPDDVQRAKAEHWVTLAAFSAAAGRDFKAGRYPKLDALFADLETEAKAVIDAGKAHWRRPRPFQDDPQRFAEAVDPEKSPGYPSGHSTRGTAFALVLAEIFPARRGALLEKGRLIGWTRVEAGVHTPLDIYAGRVLGQALFLALMRDPAFQADLAAVKAEVGGGQ